MPESGLGSRFLYYPFRKSCEGIAGPIVILSSPITNMGAYRYVVEQSLLDEKSIPHQQL